MVAQRGVTYEIGVKNAGGNAGVFSALHKEAKKLQDALQLRIGVGGSGTNDARRLTADLSTVASKLEAAHRLAFTSAKAQKEAAEAQERAAKAAGNAALQQKAAAQTGGGMPGLGGLRVDVRTAAKLTLNAGLSAAGLDTGGFGVIKDIAKAIGPIGWAAGTAVVAFNALTKAIDGSREAAHKAGQARLEATNAVLAARNRSREVGVASQDFESSIRSRRAAAANNAIIDAAVDSDDLAGARRQAAGGLAGSLNRAQGVFHADGAAYQNATKAVEDAARKLHEIDKLRLEAAKRTVEERQKEAAALASVRKTQEDILSAARGRIKSAAQKFDELSPAEQRRQLALKDKLGSGQRLTSAELAQARRTGILDEAIAQGQEARQAQNERFREFTRGTAASQAVETAKAAIAVTLKAEQKLRVEVGVSQNEVDQIRKAVAQSRQAVVEAVLAAIEADEAAGRRQLRPAARDAQEQQEAAEAAARSINAAF